MTLSHQIPVDGKIKGWPVLVVLFDEREYLLVKGSDIRLIQEFTGVFLKNLTKYDKAIPPDIDLKKAVIPVISALGRGTLETQDPTEAMKKVVEEVNGQAQVHKFTFANMEMQGLLMKQGLTLPVIDIRDWGLVELKQFYQSFK